MQDAEEPKNRSLPEQKGPHPTVVRGPKEKKASNSRKQSKAKSDPKNQGRRRRKKKIYV